MKSLLPPAFAVLCSTVGTTLGCKFVGMPLSDMKLATGLALIVSATAAFGAALLAGRPRRPHRHPAP